MSSVLPDCSISPVKHLGRRFNTMTNPYKFYRLPAILKLIRNKKSYRQSMEDFIATVSDAHLRELPETVITGRGALRRFKDVSLRYPHERKQGFALQRERIRQRTLKWLESLDIPPIPQPEP